MFRMIIFSLLFAFLAPVFAIPERAAAADNKILDATIDRYMEEATKWEPRIKIAAKSMFWILATISMVFTFAFMFARGNVGLGDFFGEFLRFIVTVGFFYWLLDNGSEIAKSIIRSFAQLGIEASSTYQAELSPSNLISFALELIGRASTTFGEQDYATSIVTLVLSIAIALLFGVIAAMMVQLLCTAWVLVYAGTVVLGFGGGRWTQDIAINYFKTVLGLALQTFTFCLLVGIGQQQVESLITASQQAKTVTVKGYVYDSAVTTTSMTITDGCVILLFTVILYMLVKTVPNAVAGIINGSSMGGVSLGGYGSGMAGAAALASGGSMIATQMAGAGLALNSAYQQTRENRELGMGLFKGAAAVGGLSGAMSSGLRSAGDFMANLASGALDATKDKAQSAKETVQANSIGGKVSANIDANRAAHQTEWSASEGKGNDEESGGNPSLSESIGDKGGNERIGDAAASNSDATAATDNVPANVNGRGSSDATATAADAAELSPTANNADAKGNSHAMQSAATGDSADTFDWGGRISSGKNANNANHSMTGQAGKAMSAKSNAAMDEWDAAIANYDPKKAGRIDDPDNGKGAIFDEWESARQNYDPAKIGLPDDK